MFARFKTRSTELERLDTGDYTPAEYAKWQREMRLIHGVLGEARALENSLIKEITAAGLTRVSILDVGAGPGELLAKVGRRLKEIKTTLIAADLDSNALGVGDVLRVQCDGTRLPFEDNSVDHAYCTLTLHHLDDGPAVDMLREMSRVARGRIFVVDLNRHPIAYYLYRFSAWFLYQKLTREDGALSILRSRTPDELYELAKSAGLVDITVAQSRVNRLVLSGRNHLR